MTDVTTRSDRRLLYATSFLRAVGTSLVGVLLGIHLAGIGFDAAEIGYVSGLGLAGAATAALAATLWADRLGRRRTLLATTLFSAAGTAVVVLASGVWLVAAAAFVGMVNAMGRDRGAALIVEQAVLPATTTDAGRTRSFAWYSALQDAGHAAGSLLAGLPALWQATAGWSATASNRAALAVHPLLMIAVAVLYVRLSSAVESPAPRAIRLSPPTRGVLWRISTLFALDGIGGGFLITTLLSYFFFERFGASPASIAALFFAARVANVASHFGAAWLARRIGLVNTMVFTHIPSSLLLVAVAYVESFAAAVALFLVREALVEMDVPTRQSYVMAVVAPEERTAAAGVTNLVRLAAWAVAPALAGVFMHRLALGTPLVAGAALKIVYDLLLYGAFCNLKPPEERRGG